MAEISRRALLGSAVVVLAAGAGAFAGTSKHVHHKVAVPPPPPPQALTDTLAAEQRLLAGYDAVIAAARPAAVDLNALRTDVTQHVDALRALLEQYPGWRLEQDRGVTSSSPTPSSTAQPPLTPTVSALAAASVTLAANTAAACLHWRSVDLHGDQAVPLLGSISACLATHGQVLR